MGTQFAPKRLYPSVRTSLWLSIIPLQVRLYYTKDGHGFTFIDSKSDNSKTIIGCNVFILLPYRLIVIWSKWKFVW